MKWSGIAVAGLLGSVVGVGATLFFFGPKGHDEDSLKSTDALQRIDAAFDRLARVDEDLSRHEKTMMTKEDYKNLLAAMPTGAPTSNDIALLQQKIASLEEELKAATAGGGSRLKIDDNGTERIVSLDEYVDAKISKATEKVSKQSRKLQMKDSKPFIKMGMNQQFQRMKTKLNLSDEQAKRMEESMNKAFDKNFANMEAIMDPEKPLAEKQAAAKEITATMEEVTTEAQTYLDPTQYTGFVEQQTQAMAGIQTMIGAQLGGGNPQPTPSGSNN